MLKVSFELWQKKNQYVFCKKKDIKLQNEQKTFCERGGASFVFDFQPDHNAECFLGTVPNLGGHNHARAVVRHI